MDRGWDSGGCLSLFPQSSRVTHRADPDRFRGGYNFRPVAAGEAPLQFHVDYSVPLIIGIGIDNGIHLVRRYLENKSNEILVVAKASGAAMIQSNLTTIVGFGALMTSSFAPLVEMGLVTSLGVALALAGGLLLIPAVILLGERRRTATDDANRPI